MPGDWLPPFLLGSSINNKVFTWENKPVDPPLPPVSGSGFAPGRLAKGMGGASEQGTRVLGPMAISEEAGQKASVLERRPTNQGLRM